MLTLGSPGFWIFLILSVVVVTIAIEISKYKSLWGTIWLILTGGIYFFAGGKQVLLDLWIYTSHHILQVILYIAIYTALGVIWSFYKWYLLLLKAKIKYDKKVLDLDETVSEDKGYMKTFKEVNTPKASKNKDRIISWMIYWPLSIIGYILSDPISKFFNWIYSKVSGGYDRMTARVFK